MSLRILVVAAFVAAGAAPAFATPDVGSLTGERQRIAAERAAAATRYAQRVRDCEGRFVVTACVEEAKQERRETLTRLKREQNQIDDALRKARAAERTESIRKREASEAQRAREAALREARQPASRPAPEPHAPRAGSGAPHDRPGAWADGAPSRSAPSADERARQEARSRATFDAAQRSAEAHRLEAERRNAERDAKHKRAAPLPVPGAASAP